MKNRYKIVLCIISIMLSAFNPVSAEIVSANSKLSISIKGVPAAEQSKISGAYVVSGEGYVNLPLLKNRIKASGKTTNRLEREIETAYINAEIYNNARITVITAKTDAGESIDSKIISVGGYVKSPGSKPYSRGMTIFKAVTSAGGENSYGAINRVELIRNGKRTVHDLRRVDDMNTLVYPGDTINVPQKTVWGN
ncbi:MAG: polysaccharide biosynthesis/export family protein [Akkermansiaceae bacterium]